MKQQVLFTQLEITFWNVLVLLLSESKAVRALVVNTYRLAPLTWLGKAVLKILGLAVAAWLLGFVLGWLHGFIG